MSNTTDCDRARLHSMASLDGESEGPSESDRQHLSTCRACQAWLQQLRAVGGQLHDLTYREVSADLWPRVEPRIRQLDQQPVLARLMAIAGLVFAWRALQLLVDLPLPALHPLVPLAAVVAAMWQLAGDPLAIETSAPELRNEASHGIS